MATFLSTKNMFWSPQRNFFILELVLSHIRSLYILCQSQTHTLLLQKMPAYKQSHASRIYEPTRHPPKKGAGALPFSNDFYEFVLLYLILTHQDPFH